MNRQPNTFEQAVIGMLAGFMLVIGYTALLLVTGAF